MLKDIGYHMWRCDYCGETGEGEGDGHQDTERHIHALRNSLLAIAEEAVKDLRDFEREHGLSSAVLPGYE